MKWRTKFGAAVHSSPSFSRDGNTIYIGCADGKFRALDKISGNIIWTFATASRIDSSPAVDYDGTIYIGSTDKSIYAIRPSGLLKWKFSSTGVKFLVS